jgi:hypothetical protein
MMRKIMLSMQVSFVGFVTGSNGEMDRIKYDDTMLELGEKFSPS